VHLGRRYDVVIQVVQDFDRFVHVFQRACEQVGFTTIRAFDDEDNLLFEGELDSYFVSLTPELLFFTDLRLTDLRIQVAALLSLNWIGARGWLEGFISLNLVDEEAALDYVLEQVAQPDDLVESFSKSAGVRFAERLVTASRFFASYGNHDFALNVFDDLPSFRHLATEYLATLGGFEGYVLDHSAERQFSGDISLFLSGLSRKDLQHGALTLALPGQRSLSYLHCLPHGSLNRFVLFTKYFGKTTIRPVRCPD
jgi:hypothetical protein